MPQFHSNFPYLTYYFVLKWVDGDPFPGWVCVCKGTCWFSTLKYVEENEGDFQTWWKRKNVRTGLQEWGRTKVLKLAPL